MELFNLVQCALNQIIYSQDIKDEETLYRISHVNGLSGMLFPVLSKDYMSPDMYMKFQLDFFAYHARDIRQLSAIEAINEGFNNKQIPHIFLKGSYLKLIYPKSYMRSMGDIDLLVHPEDLLKAHEVFNSLGFHNWQNSPNHDCFMKDKDLFVECHPKLNSEFNVKYETLFQDVWANTFPYKTFEYRFNPEFHLLYLLYHAVKHLSSSGIGLRTILDIGLFIQAHHKEMNRTTLEHMLKEANLFSFFKNMVFLNHEYFQLNDFPEYIENPLLNETDIDELTDYILKSGVHGYGEGFNRYLPGMTAQSLISKNAKKGKLTFILNLIFPKRKAMKTKYPYLDKYPFLLPWTYANRFFKLLFKKTKGSFTKLRLLKIDEKELENQLNLYQKLGL